MKEKLAKLAHSQWSGWMGYLFSKCIEYEPNQVQAEKGALIIPKWAVDRWRRQAETDYTDLSKPEMDSDRAEADKFLAVFQSQLATEQEKNRWVPVGERLLERGQPVDGYIEKLKQRIPDLKGDFVNCKKTITDSDGWTIGGLTHWRPIHLPKGE